MADAPGEDLPPEYQAAVGGEADEAHDPAYDLVTSTEQAAGLRVTLAPGGTLQTQADLTEPAKESLSSVLAKVKEKILPGEPVTDEEVTQWIDMIYAGGWQPGQYIETADEQSTIPTHGNRGFVIGMLAVDLEVSPKKLGRARSRSFIDRKLQKQTAPRATVAWRRVGAAVICLVEHKQEGFITFSLRDERGGIMSSNAVVTYCGTNKIDAYFHTMRKNDEFFAKNCHGFNIEQARYICRNRLTHWSNPGVEVGDLPPREKIELALTDLKLCRNIPNILGCPAASVANLRATPPPTLFRFR